MGQFRSEHINVHRTRPQREAHGASCRIVRIFHGCEKQDGKTIRRIGDEGEALPGAGLIK
jgi:hypothetical protein